MIVAQSSTTVPFVGLRPFDQADHQWFYGRAAETVALTHQIRDSRFTAVVGASGCGKSSLVRAGVLVALAKDGWLPIIAKPGSAPITRLATALSESAREAEEDLLATARSYRFGATLRASAYGLDEIIAKLAPAAPSLVLVIDQFEELFRYGEEARGVQQAALQEESRAFVELLVTAASHASSRLHVVITMRSDYFGNCASYAGLAEAVSASQYLVSLPSRDELEQSIRRPFEAAGARIDEALVQRLLVDVEEQVDRLPMLQHTLRALWDLAHGEPRYVGEDEYITLGGLAGSINRKAQDVSAALVTAHAEDGVTLERMMKSLTSLDEHDRATRRPQRRSELLAVLSDGVEGSRAAASFARVVAAFHAEGTSFLQIGEGDDPEIDIGHEALIRGWKRLAGESLDFTSGWLREEREDGEEWRGLLRRSEGGGLLGVRDQWRLARWTRKRRIGRAWSARYGNGWDRIQAMRRRSAWLAVGMVGALCVLVGIGVQGWRERGTEIVRQRRNAALVTAVSARTFAERGEARIAALLALGALPASRRADDPGYVPEVEVALAEALSRPIERMRVRGHQAAVSAVAFFPGGRLASVSEDQTLRLWDATTGRPIGEPLRGHGAAVSSVAILDDGKRLVSASADGTLRLWDAATGQPVGAPLRGHKARIMDVAGSPDSTRLVSASADGTLRLWDAATGQPVGAPLRGHSDAIMGVAFSPNGRQLASASADGTLRLWDAATGQPVGAPLSGHKAAVLGVAFSADGGRLASASEDQTILLWDIDKKRSTSELRGHTAAVVRIAFSHDGKWLASASADGTLRLWDALSSQTIAELRGHMATVTGVAFSPDGSQLASASADQTVRLWALGPRRSNSQLISTGSAANLDVTLSPDGIRLASTSVDGTLRLWDAATGQPVGAPLRGHTAAVTGVAFSPDGRRLATASEDQTARLWDWQAGTAEPVVLRGHTAAVTGVAFSPDGRRLATASADQTARLWDWQAGTAEPVVLRGHTAAVTGVAFSPDGRRLATASADRTIRLWDATTAELIGELRGHTARVQRVVFSLDGQRLISSSADHTLRSWGSVDPPRPSLPDLVARAETLCPLGRTERERLHLLDPRFAGKDQKLTEAQRMACGEALSPMTP